MPTKKELEMELLKEQCLKENTKQILEVDKENREWTCENFASLPMFQLVKKIVFTVVTLMGLAVVGAIINQVIK